MSPEFLSRMKSLLEDPALNQEIKEAIEGLIWSVQSLEHELTVTQETFARTAHELQALLRKKQ